MIFAPGTDVDTQRGGEHQLSVHIEHGSVKDALAPEHRSGKHSRCQSDQYVEQGSIQDARAIERRGGERELHEVQGDRQHVEQPASMMPASLRTAATAAAPPSRPTRKAQQRAGHLRR